ncbi:MAG TPA: LamG domain-containing protein [Polyangia bacterium]|nr:LamG domain-containing protein [Polyangia bacterium]
MGLALLIVPALAGAATCTWKWSGVPAGSGLWSVAANWSCGAVPGNGDDVVFDATNGTNQNCTVDVAIDVASLTLQNSYTRAVTGSGAPSMRIRGNLALASSGTLVLTNGTTQLGGAFSRTAGTLTAGTGTVIFNSAAAVTHAFGSQHFNTAIINDGLVAYWALDEGGGTTVGDRSGYANGLVLSASAFTSSVPPLSFSDPSALSFDGTVFARLSGTGTNLPDAAARQTISAWVRLGSTSGTQDAVAIGDGAGHGIKLGLSGGTLSAFGWDGTVLASGTTPTDGGWHHLAFTYDGTTNALYLDGALAGTSTTGHSGAAATVANLGSYDGAHELMAAGGGVDDVRIYNRPLNATEISALALGNAPGTGVVTHTFSSAFVSNGDFVIASGKVAGTGSVSAGGSWLNYGGVLATTGAVAVTGLGGGTLLFGGQRVAGLTVSSGIYTMNDRLSANNKTVTINSVLTDPSYVARLGLFSGTGTFNPGAGTVVLDSSGNRTLSTFANFNNLRLEDGTENNLVGYWKLDEGTGTSLYDASSKSNGGTLVGSGTWSRGMPGLPLENPSSLTFDGATAYATLGSSGIPSANASQTVSLWVKYPSAAATQTLFASVNASNGSGLFVGLSGGNVTASVYGGAALVSIAAPSANTWHHIAYVYSATGTTNEQIYVDGVAYTGGGTTSTHQSAAPSNVYLGTADGATQFFQGQLDEVRLYNTALTATQIAQLAAGRYPNLGGFSTTTLGAAVTVTGSLSVDAANLNANGYALAVTGAATISAGTYTVGGAAQTFSSGLNVQPKGTMTMASAIGSVLLGSGTSLIVDGTLNASAAGAAISSVSGRFTFKVGSTAGTTPTLNISALAVSNLDSHGMWINADPGAATVFTEFDNLTFSNGTGNQLLYIYAPGLNLASHGCTFDGSTTYAVTLVGNGTADGTETRAVFGGATCAVNAGNNCANSEKSDDDANNDGLPDSPGNGVNFGAVVQFVSAAFLAGGTHQGFPTAAFDWNTFTYYATYAVYRNQSGTADVVYVLDETGHVRYSWSTAANQQIVGTPQWTTITVGGVSTHYLYVAVNGASANTGQIYRLVDTGAGLTLDSVWQALTGGNPYACTCTFTSPLSMDANNLYWSATTSASSRQLMQVGMTNQSTLTGWPLTTPGNVTASPPALVTSGGNTTLYLGITGYLLQLDVTSTTFVSNTKVGTVNGRVTYGRSVSSGVARVFAGNSGGTMWALNPANFSGTNYLWSYAASAAISGSYYDAQTDTIQFGTNGGKLVVLTGAGSGTSGVVLNASYPYTLDATDPIQSAPLYYAGILAVGSTKGKLYFVDRNTGTTPGVQIVREYAFGAAETISAIGFDPDVNRYMVSVSNVNTGIHDARLYYFDLVADPTPSFQ